MRRVIFNQKGGVGKTSITCNLAAISASRGKRCLAIDLDVQCNTSEYLLGEDFMREENAAEFFKQFITIFTRNREPQKFAHETPYENLFILPASPELATIERELESRHKIFKLRDALITLSEDFDEIYIDTPPALNFYSRAAMIAAEELLIPFDCDSFSRQALNNLLGSVEEIREDHNSELVLKGIVVNQFQAQAKLPTQLIDAMLEDELPVLEPYLSSSVKVKESRQRHKPLVYMASKHKVSEQYAALYDSLSEKQTLASQTAA